MITKDEQLSLFEQLRHSEPRLSDELVMRRLCQGMLEEAEVLEPPVPVKMLASLRGIARIEEVDQPFAGMLQSGDSGFEVRVRRRDGKRRQRFTICHEAGHTLLPGFREARQFRCNGERSWLERMCDVAGAELLLPYELFRPLLPRKGLDLSAIEELAEIFEASVEATSRRAVSLSRGSMMMLVLSERHKPTELDRDDQVPPKLRFDYRITSGDWPFIPRHKSASEEGLARALQGEIIDEVASIDELCTEPLGEVRISAKRYGAKGRVLALIERSN